MKRPNMVDRPKENAKTGAMPDRLAVGRLVLDRIRFEVRLGGREIRLTRKEFQLLWVLASEAGRVFRREELLDQVWGEANVDSRTIDAHIVRLRRKLRIVKTAPSIEAVWGIGYRLKLSAR